MKNNFLFCSALFAVFIVLIFSGCFSAWMPETSGEGTITISFNNTGGSAAGRSPLPPWPPQDHGLFGYLDYRITLSREGESIQAFTAKDGEVVSRVVSAGFWTVKIDAYLEGKVTAFSPEGNRIHYATGSLSLPVIEGRDNPAAVKMYPICQECGEYLCICEDPQSDFYGTWKHSDTAYFIISADRFTHNIFPPHIDIKYEIISWTLFGANDQRGCNLTLNLNGMISVWGLTIHSDGNSIECIETGLIFYKQTCSHDWQWTATTLQTPCIQEIACALCGEIDAETETRHNDAGCTGTSGLVITGGVVEYNAAYLTMTVVCIPDYRNGAAVTSIGSWAFNLEGAWDGYTENTSLRSVRIGANIISIGQEAFALCSSLTTVTFASGSKLQTIGNGVFSGCTSLTSLEIPNSVTTIGHTAFNFSGLTSITIPENVSTIGLLAFSSCSNLTKINVDNNNQNYSSDEYGLLYNKEKTLLIQAPVAISGNIILPNTVTSIGNNAFTGCAVNSITIPASITSIGEQAFLNCANLESVIFESGIQLQTISIGMFSRCTSLTSITIPASVRTISQRAFAYCENLTEVFFEAGSQLYIIQQGAFQNCTSLTRITIPASVTDIINFAFQGTSNLAEINVDPGNTSFISEGGILYDFNKTTVKRGAPKSVIGAIVLPDTVTSIDSVAFDVCTELTQITIPAGVTIINYNTFYDCTALTTVTFALDSLLQTINGNAFSGCTSLTNIIIPASVTSIGSAAFYNCTSLSEIIIPVNVNNLGQGAFRESGLTKITFGGTGLFHLTANAFNNTFTSGNSLRNEYLLGGTGTYILNGTTWVKEQ